MVNICIGNFGDGNDDGSHGGEVIIMILVIKVMMVMIIMVTLVMIVVMVNEWCSFYGVSQFEGRNVFRNACVESVFRNACGEMPALTTSGIKKE